MMAFFNQKIIHILFGGFAFVAGIHCAASSSNETSMLESLEKGKRKRSITQIPLPNTDSTSAGLSLQDSSTVTLMMQTLIEQN